MKSYENSKIPRLFQLMEEKNIKASHITRDLKISSGNISDWKSGKAFPTNAVLHALADYLDTTPEYLKGETDIKEKPSDSGELDKIDREIIKIFTSLSDEKKQAALEYMTFLNRKENGEK